MLITATWLTMMFGLARDEIAPAVRHAREIAQSVSYEHLEAVVPESRVDQMGIYVGPQRIGRATTWLKRREDELVIESESVLDFQGAPLFKGLGAALGDRLHCVIRFRASVIAGRLQEFRATVSSPPGSPPDITVDGVPDGSNLVLRIRQFGAVRTETVPFDPRQLLHNAFAPGLSLRDLRVGKKWRLKNLDYLTYTVDSAWAEVVGKETLAWAGEDVEAFVIVVSRGHYTTRIWARADGTILRQQFMAFNLIREPPSQAALEELRR